MIEMIKLSRRNHRSLTGEQGNSQILHISPLDWVADRCKDKGWWIQFHTIIQEFEWLFCEGKLYMYGIIHSWKVYRWKKDNFNFLLGSIGIFPLLSIKEIIPLLFEIITGKTKKIQSKESFLISFRQFQLTNVKWFQN